MWPLGFWAALLAIPLPFVYYLFARVGSHERYGYLAALAITYLFLFILRWDRTIRMPKSVEAFSFLACGIITTTAAVAMYSPWLGTLGWVLNLSSLLNSLHGKVEPEDQSSRIKRWILSGDVSSVAKLWPLILLVLPLPMNLDTTLVFKLQSRSLQLSSYVLDLQEIPNCIQGTSLVLIDQTFDGASLCSGTQSPFTMALCAILLMVVLERSYWLMPIYVGSAVVWALLMNLLRVLVTIDMRIWFKLDCSSGWQHVAICLLSLTIAVVLMISTDRLLRIAFFPVKDFGDKKPNPLQDAWNYLFWPRQIHDAR